MGIVFELLRHKNCDNKCVVITLLDITASRRQWVVNADCVRPKERRKHAQC